MPEPRLYVHVGLQKTGTSYLQGVMFRNAEAARSQGLDLVPATRQQAFELMLSVRGRYDPERDPATAATALERFTEQLRGAGAPRALLSQESLAAAKPQQVRRLLDAAAGREVHVVLTARDLGRQLPSSWQQELKAGRTQDYHDYLERLRGQQQSGRRGHPWIHLDPPTVLSRWGRWLPRERIHVVTVPPPGGSPTMLLERFCRVIGLDAARLVPEDKPSNTSLGRVQAEVLRRVNAELPEELRRRQVYGDVGKRFFAAQVLAPQPGRPILVPEEFRAWASEVADAQVAALAEAGYAVAGDLEDLRCRPTAFVEEEAAPTESEVAAAAVSALAGVLSDRARRVEQRRAAGPGRSPRRRLARLRSRLRRTD